ncbi:MAG: Smr/MutS family protein [Tistlia sp.]|uniref:Smr/MutS family protein n=1 Tax=Tistlia sp. TaxID=3057121 RepID=UPI0034A48309
MAEERRRPSRFRLPPDMDLWQRVAREVTPIKRDRTGGLLVPPPEETAFEDLPADVPDAGPRARPVPVTVRPEQLFQGRGPFPPVTLPAKPALSHGSLADLDRRTAQRLQRGRLPIEATLDLHGLSQQAAHEALNGFVARSVGLGRRCVLIVTGKGRGEEPGVLRRQTPLWLNQAPLRAHVLAFDFARPEHGGLGALYLLLKRKREPR